MNLPRIPFHRPSVGDAEVEAAARAIRSGWLTSGPHVRRLEERLAAFLDVPHAVATSSGTDAMELVLRALDVGPGDEVVTTPFTFVATVEVVLRVGATPVLVDVEPETGNLDPEAASAAVTPRTRAILAVHVGGHPAAVDRLAPFAAERGLALVGDAAHALETRTPSGHSVAAVGDAACFSFYATKSITTGEGGLVACRNTELAERVRCLRLHGLSRGAWSREGASDPWAYDVVALGAKANLGDVAAAIGLAQLDRLPAMLARRHELAGRYDRALGDLEELELPPTVPATGRHARHLYPVRLRLDRLACDRDALLRALLERGVVGSVHFRPVHMMTWYGAKLGLGVGDFPCAESLFARTLSLPLYPDLTDEEADRVVSSFRTVIADARARRAR